MTISYRHAYSTTTRPSDSADLAATSLLEMSQAPPPPQPDLLDTWEYYHHPPAGPREESEVEQNFCSDFVCCGVMLPDLHALLQHYEESHVKMEDVDDVYAVHPYGYGKYEQPAYPQAKRRIVAMGIEPQDSACDAPSAFDTTIFRTVSPAYPAYPAYHQPTSYHPYSSYNTLTQYPPRRPRSIPVGLAAEQQAMNTLRAMLPHALANSPTDNPFKLIHTALSSTINPPRSATKRATTSRDSDESDDEHNTSSNERPYVCQVAGCGKTYKNPNGLKYHTLHGHDRDGKDTVEKPHKCPFASCTKRYKNPNGLKYHVQHGHPGQAHPGKKTVASLQSIAGLNQIEAAIKREQAIRAQLAAQNIVSR